MDPHTLNKAIRLQEEVQTNYSLANKAYNGHMYLKISLDDVDVTRKIDTTEIQEILYKHFKEKAKKAEKELDEL